MAGAWRLNAARAAAWAVLLGGWITIAHAAERLAPGPAWAYGLIAAWLLALGGFAAWLGRLRLPAGVLRALLIASALLAARGFDAALHGGGAAALLPMLLAWALLAALAATGVRALCPGTLRRPAAPLAAAAGGALLVWAVLGDPSDLRALLPRAALLLVALAVLLAALQPAQGSAPAHPGCRAGRLDCALPAWPEGAWRAPTRWPLLLASLAMLPLMGSLPQMLALCRSEALGPQAVLGLHLASMFLPALALRRSAAQIAAPLCAALLAVGPVAAALLDGATAWWWLALTQAGAWSVAWAAQQAGAEAPAATLPSPALPRAHPG